MRTEAESKFEREKRIERETRYGMKKLSLVGDDDDQPKERTLKDAVEEAEIKELSKYQHTTFASTKHNGKRVGLQISWTP